MNCEVEGCESPVIARAMCSKHYKRWSVNGHTNLTMGKGCKDPLERLQFRSKRIGSCLEWQGQISNSGYGQTKLNGKYCSAHRLSWILHKGEIPEGMFVCHKCDNKRCVDPEHLYLADQSQNTQDAIERGLIKTGLESPLAKLTKRQIDQARAAVQPIKVLAKKFGVHWSTLYRAIQ